MDNFGFPPVQFGLGYILALKYFYIQSKIFENDFAIKIFYNQNKFVFKKFFKSAFITKIFWNQCKKFHYQN